MQKQTLFTSLTLAAMVAAGLSTAALAQDAPPPPPEPELGMDFEALDADKDGKVTEAEIAAAMAAKLAAADTNKDGKLSAEELVAMREQERAARQLEMAKMMVTRLDRDGDGLVSAEELAAGPRQPTLFERMDTNGDGAITKDEADAARARMEERMDAKGRGGDRGPGRHHGPGEAHHGGPEGPRGGFWQWWSQGN